MAFDLVEEMEEIDLGEHISFLWSKETFRGGLDRSDFRNYDLIDGELLKESNVSKLVLVDFPRKKVVLKLPLDPNGGKTKRLFEMEDQALSHISKNERIVNYLGSYRIGDYAYFLVFDHVPGENLFDHVLGESSLELGVWFSMMEQSTEAIAHVHSDDYLHRDVCPANLMFDGKKVILLDFNGACPVELDDTSDYDVHMARPRYMDENARRGVFSVSSDIYALAMTGYAILGELNPRYEDNTLYEKWFSGMTSRRRVIGKFADFFKGAIIIHEYQTADQFLDGLHQLRRSI